MPTALPASLAGRYAQYKHDTSDFATWLQHTASKCGYVLEKPDGSDLSGKSRADISVALSYPVKELLNQARAAATCTSVRVVLPFNILRAAERAITARQEISKHFQQVAAVNKFNKTHSFFIKVLGEALELVKPLSFLDPSKTARRAAAEHKKDIPLSNAFEALHVETVEDTTGQDEDHIYNTEWIKPKEAATVTVLEDEDEAMHIKIDKALRVLTLLEDVQDIREFIRLAWEKYRMHEIDLSTTSMITNIAMSVVSFECQQLAEDLGMDARATYQDFMEHLQVVDEERASLRYSMEDILQGGTALQYLTSAEVAISFTEYVRTMSRDFKVQTFHMLPALRALSNGKLEKLSARSRLFKDILVRQKLLVRKLVDFGNSQRACQRLLMDERPHQRVVNQDELTKAIGSAVVSRKTFLDAVFAVEILLDIDLIMFGIEDRPLTELYHFADVGMKRFHHTHLSSPVGSGPQWGRDDSSLIHNIHGCFEHIKQIQKWSSQQPVMNCPSLRGMQMLNVEVLEEDAGVRLLNYHSSLIILSYLCNALEQKHFISTRWPDLDLAIETHLDALFFGSIPKSEKEMLLRFSLRNGLPLTAYLDLDPKFLKPLKPGKRMTKARKGGRSDESVKSKLSGNCLKMTPTSLALEKYFDEKETLVRTAHAIMTIAEKNKPNADKLHAAQSMGPVKFLTVLQDWLLGHRKYIKLDYVQLTRDCHTLMEEIATKVKPRMETDLAYILSPADRKLLEDARNNVPGASTIHTMRYLDIVNKILADDKMRSEYHEAIEVAKKIGVYEESKLEKAAPFVQKFIKKKLKSAASARKG